MLSSNDSQWKIGKALAHPTDKKARQKALKLLQKWLRRRAESDHSISLRDALLVWKALFYAFWLSDKRPVQTQLASQLSALQHVLAAAPEAWLAWVGAFYQILLTEWTEIDRFRLEKYLMLVRMFVYETLRYLQNRKWDAQLVRQLNDVYVRRGPFAFLSLHTNDVSRETATQEEGAKVPKTPTRAGFGCLLQLTDVLMDEWDRCTQGQHEKDPDSGGAAEALAIMLQPFVKVLCVSTHEGVLDRICVKVMARLPAMAPQLTQLGQQMFQKAANKNTGVLHRQYLYKAVDAIEQILRDAGESIDLRLPPPHTQQKHTPPSPATKTTTPSPTVQVPNLLKKLRLLKAMQEGHHHHHQQQQQQQQNGVKRKSVSTDGVHQAPAPAVAAAAAAAAAPVDDELPNGVVAKKARKERASDSDEGDRQHQPSKSRLNDADTRQHQQEQEQQEVVGGKRVRKGAPFKQTGQPGTPPPPTSSRRVKFDLTQNQKTYFNNRMPVTTIERPPGGGSPPHAANHATAVADGPEPAPAAITVPTTSSGYSVSRVHRTGTPLKSILKKRGGGGGAAAASGGRKGKLRLTTH
ncbi:unnamed protein product [Vitrella brassicaformis CCMP3155]|uniref:Uncharacterized protein n=2 Tax=Vitrella brassicaformis TaxID=1169539 RepID=A0A0G4EWU0_VITBC|nr:unnamed protein product [Vitrella brassicaformis CCMP3155]|eukprot:CEM02734.1 unnamed protein product [Vitrella brassicaformis CCMP3155]